MFENFFLFEIRKNGIALADYGLFNESIPFWFQLFLLYKAVLTVLIDAVLVQ